MLHLHSVGSTWFDVHNSSCRANAGVRAGAAKGLRLRWAAVSHGRKSLTVLVLTSRGDTDVAHGGVELD